MSKKRTSEFDNSCFELLLIPVKPQNIQIYIYFVILTQKNIYIGAEEVAA